MKLNKKILIVEDNQVNLELFLDILGSAGYNCIYTTDGQDVIKIAKKEMPDLILLDIHLPNRDGLSVLKLLRSQEDTKNIKVIALTAFAMKGDDEKFFSQGFDGYIPKPIRVKEFLQTIKKYLN